MTDRPPEQDISSTATQPPGAPDAFDESTLPPDEDYRARGPRVAPALLVLGLVAVVAGGGAALALIGSSPARVAAPGLGTLKGQSLAAVSASPVVARIRQLGKPPNDVGAALVVPDGTTIAGVTKNAGLGLFSASVTLDVPARATAVVAFFRAELAHDGWSGVSVVAPATGPGTEVLAKRPGSTGYYWGVGLVVKSSGPSISPELAGGSAPTPTSTVSFTLYEIDDAN